MPSSPILEQTAEHDLREGWLVPASGGGTNWVVNYDADFGGADGGKALGYTGMAAPLPTPLPAVSLWAIGLLGLLLLVRLNIKVRGSTNPLFRSDLGETAVD